MSMRTAGKVRRGRMGFAPMGPAEYTARRLGIQTGHRGEKPCTPAGLSLNRQTGAGASEGKMANRKTAGAGPMTWVLRGVLALAALSAPVITFRAFTDTDTPDPVRQQRLREVRSQTEGPPSQSGGTTAGPRSEG